MYDWKLIEAFKKRDKFLIEAMGERWFGWSLKYGWINCDCGGEIEVMKNE